MVDYKVSRRGRQPPDQDFYISQSVEYSLSPFRGFAPSREDSFLIRQGRGGKRVSREASKGYVPWGELLFSPAELYFLALTLEIH